MDYPVLFPPPALSPPRRTDPDLARAALAWLCETENHYSCRGLIVAAHPDDEIIGAGSRLPRLACSCFVHVTDGAPRNLEDARAYGFSTWEDYAQARRQEFLSALALAGVPARQSIELGYPDQESSFHLVEMARELQDLISRLEPEFILTHPYEGGHPDHDSACFAVHAACCLLAQEGHPAPPVLEFCSYHQGPNGIQAGEFLECTSSQKTVFLSSSQKQLKKRMFDCFATQRQVLSQFSIELERFRQAPLYAFSAAPHPGTLFYEQYPWGMEGAQWRRLAEAARDSLHLLLEN